MRILPTLLLGSSCFAAAAVAADAVAPPAHESDVYFAKQLGAPAGTAYTVGFDRLYRINLSTGERTLIGQVRDDSLVYNDIEGLAFSPDGALYGVTDYALKVLLRIDPATGRAQRIGHLGLNGQGAGPNDQFDFGLAFTCDGKLWLSSDATRRLWEVDPRSGQARLVGDLGVPITGLAGRDGELLGLGGKGDRNLYRIDRDTARVELIGPVKPAEGVAWSQGGLDFDAEGVLWASLDYVPNALRPADLLRVNVADGRGTLIATLALVDNTGARSLAIAPPPCAAPSGVLPSPRPVPALSLPVALVAVLGLALLAWRRLR